MPAKTVTKLESRLCVRESKHKAHIYAYGYKEYKCPGRSECHASQACLSIHQACDCPAWRYINRFKQPQLSGHA